MSPTGSNAQTDLGVPHVFRVAVVGTKALDSEVNLGVENKEDGEGEYSVDYEVHVGQVDLKLIMKKVLVYGVVNEIMV